MLSTPNLLTLVMVNGPEILWTITGVVGALMLAIKNRFSPWAWPVWILSNIAGIAWALSTDSYGALIQQVVFLAINIIGTNQWLVSANRKKSQSTEVLVFSYPSEPLHRPSPTIESESVARVQDRIISSMGVKTTS